MEHKFIVRSIWLDDILKVELMDMHNTIDALNAELNKWKTVATALAKSGRCWRTDETDECGHVGAECTFDVAYDKCMELLKLHVEYKNETTDGGSDAPR